MRHVYPALLAVAVLAGVPACSSDGEALPADDTSPIDTGAGPGVDTSTVADTNTDTGVEAPAGFLPGEFSTPSAALYALHDPRPRGVPTVTRGGLHGNGHSVSWDGRVYVRAIGGGWQANVFRPERIVRHDDGTVRFDQGAFSGDLMLERDADAPDIHHNWLAIVPDPTVNGENPYPSTASGDYAADGTHHTYDAVVYHTSEQAGGNDLMGLRRARFVVADPHTADAHPVAASFTSAFEPLQLEDGSDFRCIEPSATMDARLIVCQGHPEFDFLIDTMVYSWNPVPAAATGWRDVRSIADMHHVDRDVLIDGVSFQERYPLAQAPILDAEGVPYAPGEVVKGAYPWVSRDGSELFYQASKDGVEGRRTGTSVVGRWTGWIVRHIDGPINRNRHETDQFVDRGRRLFLSSPGAFTTMWSPFKDVADLAIPYSVRGPSYPIFGSNSQDYSEVGFDDYLDGNFVVYLGMNEQLNRTGTYLPTRTNDTSGHVNNGTLVGAKFPLEYDGRDEIVGRNGQAIYVPSGAYVEVARNDGWDTFDAGVSVDLWVKKLEGSGTLPLFRLDGGLEVTLTEGDRLLAALTDTTGERRELAGGRVGEGTWDHVAVTFDAQTRQARLYLNGDEVAAQALDGFGTVRTTGAVRLGLVDATGLLLLDEVKVSNVARQPYEIAYYAYQPVHDPADDALVEAIPDHLAALAPRASAVDRFSAEAAALGEDLFADMRLSKQRTTSCVTCHRAELAFTDGLPVSPGNEPTGNGQRNTPTILNRLFSTLQGWGGLSPSLDTQALVPIQAPHEMNLPIDEAVARVARDDAYADRFQAVYGEPPDATNLAAALGSFMAVQFAPETRVDRYLAGDTAALSASERRGMMLFEGKARCSGCHAGPNFTDESFRNNGLTFSGDVGRFEATGRERDRGLFKVPTLRELTRTAPYMHDGSLATLREVVEAYDEGAAGHPRVDTDIRPLELSAGEIDDLVAFLKALSADTPGL